jgi:hypothetical protein
MASTSFFVCRTLMIVLFGAGSTPAFAAPLCKPVLAFQNVRFSPMQPETMERTWSATLSVDASRCATTAGRFEILFSRLKENAPEIDFTEAFTWQPVSVQVSVNFWADEAVEAYWLHNIAACPCRE